MPKLKDFNSTAITVNGRKNNQDYCILIDFDPPKDRPYRYMIWSFELQAPISHFMGPGEANELTKGLINMDLERLTAWTYNLNQGNPNPSFDQIIAGNHAGPNNETLTWEEIKELYER